MKEKRIIDITHFRLFRYIYKGSQMFWMQGPFELLCRIIKKIEAKIPVNYMTISERTRRREEAERFQHPVLFSILVPLYNTPVHFLQEMIESVQAQTYSHWELCLADGSDATHQEVAACVRQYQKTDSRIRYKKLEHNLGISENTNVCIRMAHGEYICLFDHDDLLHPSVLYENMKSIQETGADLLYTDEAVFAGDDVTKIMAIHLKPDFSIDNLRANNYICHFITFSRSLLQQSGCFRSQFDGSQDHDLILRLTQHAQTIIHIPKVLYFWRSHADSVAQNLGAKPYAIQAGVKAVQDHLEACDLPCQVQSIPQSPTLYHVAYQLKEKPLISIILSCHGKFKELEKCLQAILNKTTYRPYEIIIVIPRDIACRGAKMSLAYKDNPQIRWLVSEKGEQTDNVGAEAANGKHLVFFSEYVSIVTEQWLEELLMYSQREDVGAVSPLLLYPNGAVYHAGYVLGIGKDHIAGISHAKMPKGYMGYMGRLLYSQNVSAVTKECLMVKKSCFEAVGGFEPAYHVAYADVDFCLKLRNQKLLNIWTPYAQGFVRSLAPARKKIRQKRADVKHFWSRWKSFPDMKRDPFYNPNFTKGIDYQINYKNINRDKREG